MEYYDYYDEIEKITDKYRAEVKDDEEKRKIQMMWEIIETTSSWLNNHTLF